MAREPTGAQTENAAEPDDFPDSPPSRFRPASLITAAIIVASLYLARDILLPVALAILLSFILAPVVRWLCRVGIGYILSVMIAVGLASLVIVGVAALVATQLGSLAQNLPQYETIVREKIRSVNNAAAAGIFAGASRFLRGVENEIANPDDGTKLTPGGTASDAESPPMPVTIQQPGLKPFEVVKSIIGPALAQLASIGLVIICVIFFLLKRGDLRDRLIRLAGVRDLHRTSEAITDAAGRVSRYLLMQTVVNAIFSVPVGIGLWLIGVPNPVLWAILAMVLRYVPYVGPLIAAAIPIALSIAVDPGWSMLAWTVGLFLALELITNNIVEPWLYGTSTGLSPVAIILAATFWTWLWGPVGLMLSTPLTSCFVVLGRHVPQFRFLEVALGDLPPLAPDESLYLRLLAGDLAGAAAQAEEFLKERPLLAFYDEVLISALTLAQEDVRRGALRSAQRAQILASVAELLEELSEYEEGAPGSDTDPPSLVQDRSAERSNPVEPSLGPENLPESWHPWPVLCLASRTDLDEAAAAVLAQLLGKSGVGVRVLPWEAVSLSNIKLLDASGVQVLCLSCLDPRVSAHLKLIVRRLRKKFPLATIVVGFWTRPSDETGNKEISETGANFVARSLRDATTHIFGLARGGTTDNVATAR